MIRLVGAQRKHRWKTVNRILQSNQPREIVISSFCCCVWLWTTFGFSVAASGFLLVIWQIYLMGIDRSIHVHAPVCCLDVVYCRSRLERDNNIQIVRRFIFRAVLVFPFAVNGWWFYGFALSSLYFMSMFFSRAGVWAGWDTRTYIVTFCFAWLLWSRRVVTMGRLYFGVLVRYYYYSFDWWPQVF